MKVQFISASLVIFESELFRTTTTLVVRDEYLLLVDPNWLPLEVDFIHNYVAKIRKDKKCYLLFTHSDYDHIIGYGKFKNFTTIASASFAVHPHKEKCMDELHDFDDQYYIQRSYKHEYPNIDIEVDSATTEINLGRDIWEMIQAIGHNRDGLMMLNLSEGLLIAGDYLSNIEFPFIYESWTAYYHTLQKVGTTIEEGKINLLIPGHGDHTFLKEEMSARINHDLDYLLAIKNSVLNDKDIFNVDDFLSNFRFRKKMKAFHEENVQLVIKEFSI